MASSIEMLKIDLVDQLEYMARLQLGSELAETAVVFLRALYVNVPPSDLVPERPEALLEAGVSLLEFVRQRPARGAKVRVYEARRTIGTQQAPHTIIDIVNDDMPFLVDSVRSTLERMGAEVRLLIHPILEVARDEAGTMLALRATDPPLPGAAESVMHICISALPKEELAQVESRLRAVLLDVAQVVADFGPMRQHARAQARALREGHLHQSEGAQEVAEFLDWLCEDHFVFQGYSYGRFERAPLSLIPPSEGESAPSSKDGSGVRFDRDRGLGILRDPKRSMFDVFEPPRKRELLCVLKANRHSTVHRPVHLDTVIVSDFDALGVQRGAHMFVGLFTSAAYASPPANIPVLHHKIDRVIAQTGFSPGSYNFRTLRYILETYPRDELFQISESDLFSISLGIFHLQARQRAALFVRRDPFGRFVSCLVYLPRDRMEIELRLRIQEILLDAFRGQLSAYYPRIGDEPLARIHFIIKTPHGTPDQLDFVALERRIENATRSWKDRLAITLPAELGQERGSALVRRYAEAFPLNYRADFDEIIAVGDIECLEAARESGKLTLQLYRSEAAPAHELRFKVFSPNAYVAPSDVLPILENLGLRVVGEVPYEIQLPEAVAPLWLHDYSLVTQDHVGVDLSQIQAGFYEVFARTWEKRVDDDAFNKLVLHAQLSARQVALLRAYAKYLRQIQVPFSEGYMQQTLRKNANIARGLVELFEMRFDPELQVSQPVLDLSVGSSQIAARLATELDAVQSLDEDRILRLFLSVIQATTRTNFWQTEDGGELKDHISFKIDSSRIPEVPRPAPFREIFVSGPRVEGVHLRFGEVARGGVRWSDRQEDFRTEVLGLAKAQQVKNAVIVPVGSKGGFVVKRPPAADAGRDALRAEGIACYEIFVSSLLDLTDNRRYTAPNGPAALSSASPPTDVIVAPARTTRHDGPDPYLVVAADKGTATFSDIANRISERRGFWLGDAFASGGSAGYDHKQMGITARGVWECVKRHFRELGKDIQSADFTSIGVGDMSGDVFGNGLLLSKHTKLVAAFDHRHIFLDPSPDAQLSWQERSRLFQLDRSSWDDYDRKLLSAGGGVFPRTQKRIPLSPEVRTLLGESHSELDPSELIRAILRAKVELLFFGGIGTYVKATSESDSAVGDRANDALRVNANELGALVVGEGANLAMTQRARIEFSLAGGRCNSDFIDNSAGVDCSDHEVNIKILLGDVERQGDLTREERNVLLREMTDAVAGLVLRDNYLQSQSLSVTTQLSQHLTDRIARSLRILEKTGKLQRRLEALPDDESLADRQRMGTGFVRPELCVLMAYAKNWLSEELIAAGLPDDPLLRRELLEYFPLPLRERFGKYIFAHRLRREITATMVTNDLINRVGIAFVNEVGEATGAAPAAVALTYVAAREVVQARELWSAIEALDNRVEASTQVELLVECARLLERVTIWLLHEHPGQDIQANVSGYQTGIRALGLDLGSMLSKAERAELGQRSLAWTQLGVPQALADRVASLRFLLPGVDIVRVAELSGVELAEAGRLYFRVGRRFGFEWLRARTLGLPTQRAWDRQAVAALRNELFASQRDFTLAILREVPGDADTASRVRAWGASRQSALTRWEQLLAELRATSHLDFAMVTVAARQLKAIAGVPSPATTAAQTATAHSAAAEARPVSSLRSAS
jgi:glutamate dehydrogenase